MDYDNTTTNLPVKQRILVAEDEVPLAKALHLKLTNAGYDVAVVGDGEQALAAIDAGTYALLILDLVMPKLDGFAVLEKIGTSKPNMHIIVLSNLSQDEDRKRVAAYGVKDYFVKSDTPINDIIKQVNTLLAHGTTQ